MKRPAALLLAALLLLAPLASAWALPAEGESGLTAEDGTRELVFKWLNFALVFGAGAYFAAPWLRRQFAEMRGGIQSEIAAAREKQEASRLRLREVEQRLARLQQDVEALRKEALANAAAEKLRIHEAAAREAERILATTRAEMESVTRAARLELRAYAARLAVTFAEENIRRRLTPQTHAALFQAFAGDLTAPGKDRRP